MSERPWSWENDTIESWSVEGLAAEKAQISVLSETPVTKSGDHLPRLGNRYYPTMVRVWLGFYDPDGSEITNVMLADDARLIAKALLRAADLADATDAPDVDACGHWHPCHCDGGTK